MWKSTLPLPVSLAALLMVIHDTSLDAVHAQLGLEAVTLTDLSAFPAPTENALSDSVKVHVRRILVDRHRVFGHEERARARARVGVGGDFNRDRTVARAAGRAGQREPGVLRGGGPRTRRGRGDVGAARAGCGTRRNREGRHRVRAAGRSGLVHRDGLAGDRQRAGAGRRVGVLGDREQHGRIAGAARRAGEREPGRVCDRRPRARGRRGDVHAARAGRRESGHVRGRQRERARRGSLVDRERLAGHRQRARARRRVGVGGHRELHRAVAGPRCAGGDRQPRDVGGRRPRAAAPRRHVHRARGARRADGLRGGRQASTSTIPTRQPG